MTTNETDATAKGNQLEANLARIEALSQRLIAAFANKRTIDPSLQGPGQDLYLKTANAYVNEMLNHPSRILETQVAFWGKTLQHFVEAQEALAQGKTAVPAEPGPRDKRFANPLWDEHPYFNFIKQQYLINARAVDDAVKRLEGLDAEDSRRLNYFARQIVDMMSPANFLGTNPEALSRAVETEGASLVQGLENLVRDLEANDGEVVVTLADRKAFEVGGNIATTEGSVVYRNRLFELIQYKPTTKKVHRTPLVIFPPWINKFYILDLKPTNSLVRWLVEQGHTLFVVSWVNPDESYADVGLDTYIEEGYLTAFEQIRQITGEKQLNAVGYCIAGTMLAVTLALMRKRKDKSVNAATFFTTLTDFEDQGEFGVFLQDDFVDGIERVAMEAGVLDSFYMARTFSFLRSNDLIYAPAIRSYMLGEAPPAFDLLYWNSDGTNLPARMAVEYLRWLCQDNRFAGDGLQVCGETVRLSDVRVPLCAVGCETDHIAAWSASFTGIRQMGSADKRFILSQSGHIAGIINPPSKDKYGHYTNADLDQEAAAWRQGAKLTPGSWWPRWGEWLKQQSGGLVPARLPGADGRPILCPAPGEYVRSRPSH